MRLFCKRNTRDSIPYILYDLSIDDLEERKQKAIPVHSATKAAQYLGVSRTLIPIYATLDAIKGRRRIWSAKHNKFFAVRPANPDK